MSATRFVITACEACVAAVPVTCNLAKLCRALWGLAESNLYVPKYVKELLVKRPSSGLLLVPCGDFFVLLTNVPCMLGKPVSTLVPDKYEPIKIGLVAEIPWALTVSFWWPTDPEKFKNLMTSFFVSLES